MARNLRKPWPTTQFCRPGGSGGTPVQDCDPMDSIFLASLAIQLLASIHSLSGYPASNAIPEIHQAPLAEIYQRFCNGTCAAQAFYRPGEGMYIDETFVVQNNLFALP